MECSSKYRRDIKYKSYLEHPEEYQGVRNIRFLKEHILEEQKHRCAICNNLDVWNDKPIVFILDHIDGHADNNYRSNLRLICPNCDSQLDTYKSKNKKQCKNLLSFKSQISYSSRFDS